MCHTKNLQQGFGDLVTSVQLYFLVRHLTRFTLNLESMASFPGTPVFNPSLSRGACICASCHYLNTASLGCLVGSETVVGAPAREESLDPGD